jgi:hypothetical protein
MTPNTNGDRPLVIEQHDHIHKYFGLSYCNYLVLPRTLLQSMPADWQQQFVAALDELGAAFAHVPQASVYKVEAAEEHEVGDLTDDQLKTAGITVEDGHCNEDHDHDANEGSDCWPERIYTEMPSGREMRSDERALIPVPDPVPAYSRGRTRIEPRKPA